MTNDAIRAYSIGAGFSPLVIACEIVINARTKTEAWTAPWFRLNRILLYLEGQIPSPCPYCRR